MSQESFKLRFEMVKQTLAPPVMALNLCQIFSEYGSILRAQRPHFLTLLFIFLFPLSFSLLLYPTFTKQNSLFFPLLYTLFVWVLSHCGVISITYSIFHFFHGQPIKLLSAINSISTSFLPLLVTTILSQVIIFFISLFYGLLMLLIIGGAMLANVTISISNPTYLIGFFVTLPLLLLLIYLQVNWTLVPVLVVVESCWGYESLRRSARLMKGMKGVALSSFLFFGFFMGITVLNCFYMTRGYHGDAENWGSVVCYWLGIGSNGFFIAAFMLGNIAVNTMLYIHCKADKGELPVEFEKNYVKLSIHDDV